MIYKNYCPKCQRVYYLENNIFNNQKCSYDPCKWKNRYKCKNYAGKESESEVDFSNYWDKRCPICNSLMKKIYYFPLYYEKRIIEINHKNYFSDLSEERLKMIIDYVVINEYLRKFSINIEGEKVWGLVDYNGTVLIPAKYYTLDVTECGRIFVTFKRDKTSTMISSNFADFEIDAWGNPILREETGLQKGNIISFIGYDAIYNIGEGFFVSIVDNKEGIVYKDGTTVVEPIFDRIEGRYNVGVCAYKNSTQGIIRLFLGTYGDGLICAEDQTASIDNNHYLQYFMDRYGNKQIVFDRDWLTKNNLYETARIPSYSNCHFENGFIELEFELDRDYGVLYKIDKKGNAEFINTIDNSDPNQDYFDPAEDLNWDGYETYGYNRIDEEDFRDAFDDDPNGYGNIE